MKINKDLNEWIDILQKNKIIERLNSGEKFSSINVDLGFDADSDALRKAIKRIGYKKHKRHQLYYFQFQEDIMRFMDSIDIEATVEQIAQERYYSCVCSGDDFWGLSSNNYCCIKDDIFKEYVEISKDLGCDCPEDLIHMVLLEWLEQNKPVNKRKEHLIRYMKTSNDFEQKEVDFILKKYKEGYDLEELFATSTDITLYKLTDKEFMQEHISKINKKK
ncbi:hypothetical protein [Clostridium sp. DL1XJH146]